MTSLDRGLRSFLIGVILAIFGFTMNGYIFAIIESTPQWTILNTLIVIGWIILVIGVILALRGIIIGIRDYIRKRRAGEKTPKWILIVLGIIAIIVVLILQYIIGSLIG